MNPINEQIAKTISEALFNNELHSVIIEGNLYKIYDLGNGCREISYQGIRFRTQNTESWKKSLYARAAREKGEKIVWGIRPGPWIYLRNHKLIEDDQADKKELIKILGEDKITEIMKRLLEQPV